MKGETRTPEFLAKNPNGRIPMLELEAGTFLAESNAILLYLAEGTPFLPADRWQRAQVLQWMCFEQYSHEPNIATVRFWLHCGPRSSRAPRSCPASARPAYAALGVMEGHLARRRFFVGRALHDRGHRALRVHARGGRGRLRARPRTRRCAPGSSASRASRATSRSRRASGGGVAGGGARARGRRARLQVRGGGRRRADHDQPRRRAARGRRGRAPAAQDRAHGARALRRLDAVERWAPRSRCGAQAGPRPGRTSPPGFRTRSAGRAPRTRRRPSRSAGGGG